MSGLKILKKKVLITGSNGLLGQKVVEAFISENEVYGLDIQGEPLLRFDNYAYRKSDITNRKEIVEVAEEIKPDVIVNAAAYTAVDASENDKELQKLLRK